MRKYNYIKFYRVFKNETDVTEISVNNFIPVAPRKVNKDLAEKGAIDANCSFPYVQYSLPSDEKMYYGYMDKATAMEKAKSGALFHINQMIAELDLGIKRLVEYRNDHYDDLNINLLDSNTQRIKREIYSK